VVEERILLEHEAEFSFLEAERARIAPVDLDHAGIRKLEPRNYAQQRGLSGAGGTEKTEELLLPDLEINPVEHERVLESFGEFLYFYAQGTLLMQPTARQTLLRTPFENGLEDERGERHQRQQRCNRECGGKVKIIIEHFDVQRHGGGEPDNVSRYDGDRTELANSAPVAQ
jgi:hypothetical protein